MSPVHLERTTEWPSEPRSGRGRSHGTSSREPFDRWFRYPAGFASDYVRLLLDRLELAKGTVVDCFAGSGVTGTAARARGLGFAGIEAHPLVAELARIKLAPTASGDQVRALARDAVEAVRPSIAEGCEGDLAVILRREPDLVRRSFSDETLSALVLLREAIKGEVDDPAAVYLKWALLGTLRDVAGVKVGWPYQRPAVMRKPRHSDTLARFALRAEAMATDLEMAAAAAAGTSNPAAAQVVVGDSRDPQAWARLSARGNACIASPPYLNNFDYADATRLELYFWGEVTTWGEMCREVRGDMVTATTQQSSVVEKAASIDDLSRRLGSDCAPVRQILELVDAMTTFRREREGRSKEYDQVAPAYFAAMWDILENLYGNLEAGSTALWLVGDSAPYGVYIDTPRLIGELAETVGFAYTDDVHLRARGNRWGQNNDRHKVPLAERLIVLEKR